MKVSIEMKGMDDLQRRLMRLPESVENRVVGKSLRAGGAVLRAAIARTVPRSERPHEARAFKSGAGGAKGRHGQMGASHAADHVVMALGASKHSLAVGPADDWWYTIFMERGTVHQRPQGKVRAAFDATGPDALEQIRARLWAGISQAESL